MLRRQMRRLYRDRRRYALVAVFLFVSGAVTFWHSPVALFGLPMPLVAGLAFMLGIGVFMPPVCLLRPNWRFAFEITTLALMLFTLAGTVVPALSLETLTSDIWVFGGFLIFAEFLRFALYGSWSDRWLARETHTMTARAWSPLPPETLFPGVGVTPRTPDDLRPEDVVSIDELDDGERYRIVEQVPPGALMEEHRRIEVSEPPHHLRYHWDAVSAPEGAPFATGTADLRLRSRAGGGSGTRLEKTLELGRTPLRSALMFWVDDLPGRNLDETLDFVEARLAARAPAGEP